MKTGLSFVLLFILICLQAQQPLEKSVKEINEEEEKHLDSLIRNEQTIDLGSATLYVVKLETDADKKYYNRLKNRLIGVYPYVRETVLLYYHIKDSLSRISGGKQKKFLKQAQKELDEEFNAKLKKMSRWQGELFVKLIHRETGKSVIDIIKELRGGMTAFMFQAKAGLFNIDLDSKFNPAEIREDRFIEDILHKGSLNGPLKAINPKEKPKYQLRGT